MICSPMVRIGFSDVIGSWKIIEMSRPRISRIWSSSRSSNETPGKRCSLRDPARKARQQPHDRKRGDRFAGAELADDGHHFAAPDRKAQAFDRAHDTTGGAELGMQVVDFQKRGNRLGLRVRSFTQCVASLGDTQPYPLALAARHHARCPRPPKARMGARLKSRKCVITHRPASAEAPYHTDRPLIA